ncbi:MAG: beta-galactosidase [Treponema sp.]|nr:beta-galactosidase [Treponema sp.]
MRKFLPFVFFAMSALILSCPGGGGGAPDSSVIALDFTNAVFQGPCETVPADFAGMCHTGYSNNLEREYAMLNEMGVEWLHRDFSWSAIQPSEDAWDFSQFDGYVERANAEGKKVMGMLLYDVNWVHDKFGYPRERRIREDELPFYVEYAVQTVKRYNGKPGGAGKVDAWLIWNEPDLESRFWKGTKEEFYALTKAAAGAIRDLDAEEGTETMLIGGVFSPLASDAWIKGLFESGAMDQVDCVAFHPYSPTPPGSLAFYDYFRQTVAPYGFADKIWLNETGYPSYSEKGEIPAGRYGTDQYEGDMPEVAAKTFTLLAAAGAKNLTWYHMFDSASRNNSDSENWFGLVWRKSDDEWVRKGGYWGYALCAKNLPGKTYRKPDFPGRPIPDDLGCYYFEGDGGGRALLVWNNSPLLPRELELTLPGGNHRLWNVETGESVSIGRTSSHTLYPVYTYRQTLAFVTWEE